MQCVKVNKYYEMIDDSHVPHHNKGDLFYVKRKKGSSFEFKNCTSGESDSGGLIFFKIHTRERCCGKINCPGASP